MSRTTYYKDENFTLEYETKGNIAAVHCFVHDWKISSLRQGYSIFGKFLNDMKAQGFKTIITATPNPKFARLFGGVYSNSFIYLDEEIEVIKWELD